MKRVFKKYLFDRTGNKTTKLVSFIFICQFITFFSCCQTSESEVVRDLGVIFPEKAKSVLNITKAPYYADNTGKVDCSDAIIQAFNDVMGIVRTEYNITDSLLKTGVERLGFESKAGRGAVFPHKSWPSYIIYFPNGIYKVSKTICYDLSDVQNGAGSEMNRQIRIVGQSMENTILRLADESLGFEEGMTKPVLSFMRYPDDGMPDMTGEAPLNGIHGTRGAHSNVSMSNYCENLTIDVGRKNPGAIGLLFHSNNSGAIRNVNIISSDEDKHGAIGLAMPMGKPMGNYTKNVSVNGFDYGILLNDRMLYTVLEHITLTNQNKAGIKVFQHPVAIRDLKSDNKVPALHIWGDAGYAAIVNCELTGQKGADTAIELENGYLFAQNVLVSGYKNEVAIKGIPSSLRPDFVSKTLKTDRATAVRSLGLEVEETPKRPFPDQTEWVFVNDFGAIGDGINDDTEAVQSAMNSGKKVIAFQPGQYLLNGTIKIPSTVDRINFMYCDLKAGTGLSGEIPNFKVIGESPVPLIIEDILAWEDYHGEFYFLDHASKRTIVLGDLHFQVAAAYRNSVTGGKVFIENVASTVAVPGTEKPCFKFENQKVWARQLNPERADPEVINDGSDLWVLGFKTEMGGVSFVTKNGGRSEIIGGVVNNYGHKIKESQPIIQIDNTSKVSFTGVTNGRSDDGHYFKVITQREGKPEVTWDQILRRYENQSVIPLYSTETSN